MAGTKSQGSSSNGRDSNGQRLGMKCYGGEKVLSGHVLIRQRGTKIHPGKGVKIGSDDTLYAVVDGIVQYQWMARGKKRAVIITEGEARNFAGQQADKAKAKTKTAKV